MDHSDAQLKAMGLEDIVGCPRSMLERRLKPHPEQALKCPRCDSANTKFCYYNNYSLSQPRYFCKACRRYWTKGGSLRNVPVGGGYRKNKRSNSKKTHDPAQPNAASSSLLPPIYDPIMGTNDLNPTQEILAKRAVNPCFFTQIDPLGTGFPQMGFTDLSLYSLPTGVHNVCSTFSHGNLERIDGGNSDGQLVMYNAIENVAFIRDDVSKTRDGDGRVWGTQWQNASRESGFEEVKEYWSGGAAIGGAWSTGLVSNYGTSSVSPFI